MTVAGLCPRARTTRGTTRGTHRRARAQVVRDAVSSASRTGVGESESNSRVSDSLSPRQWVNPSQSAESLPGWVRVSG